MNDQELNEAFLLFADELLRAAKTLVWNQHGGPWFAETFNSFQADGSVHHGSRTVKSYDIAVRMVTREICHKQAARACIRAHVGAGIQKAPADVAQDSDEAYAHGAIILAEPVIRAVEQAGQLDIEPSVLLATYQRARDAWRGQGIETQVWIPLLNIEGELPPVTIGEGFQLSKFLPDEKNALFGRWLNQELITAGAIGRSLYKLSGTANTNQSQFKTLVERIAAQAECIVTAIRLLTTGSVGAPVAFHDRRPYGLGLYPANLETLSVRPYGTPTRLKEEDIVRIQSVFDELHKLNFPTRKSAIGAALRRFNLSHSRQSREDKLIDLAIAWESSLLNDTQDELTYKLSLRGATLLARSREPSETSSLLKSAYRARSKIVHNAESISDEALLPKCEDVTRDVLRSYVTRIAAGESLASINEQLDRDILTALKRASG